MNDEQIAAFVHREHGRFQSALLLASPDSGRLKIYEVNECVIRPADPVALSQPPLVSMTEIPAAVFLFITRRLEALNHFFVSELVQTALRSDCGVATGISVTEDYFAVKRQLFASVGGLPVVSTGSSSRLFSALVDRSHAEGLKVLSTPRAVATFSE